MRGSNKPLLALSSQTMYLVNIYNMLRDSGTLLRTILDMVRYHETGFLASKTQADPFASEF
jgi:hypothetical protein